VLRVPPEGNPGAVILGIDDSVDGACLLKQSWRLGCLLKKT